MYGEKLTVTLRMREDCHFCTSSPIFNFEINHIQTPSHVGNIQNHLGGLQNLDESSHVLFCSFFYFFFQTSTAILVNASPLSLYIYICLCLFLYLILICILMYLMLYQSINVTYCSCTFTKLWTLTLKSVCVCGGYHILQNSKYCII